MGAVERMDLPNRDQAGELKPEKPKMEKTRHVDQSKEERDGSGR
jgi:hypothetical protein